MLIIDVYNIRMRAAKTISITLSPELLARAEELAQREHLTISELFRDALLRYIVGNALRDDVFTRTQAKGKTLGITSETDVETLSDE